MPDYTPTFADLCSAIADGGVIATLDGSMYEVNAFEFRRYLHKSRKVVGTPPADDQSATQEAEYYHPQSTQSTQRH
jgi:hypothetical protein